MAERPEGNPRPLPEHASGNPERRSERLVDQEVSLAKLDRQLANWQLNEALHRRRGLLLVRRDGLEVDLLLLARGGGPVPLVATSVRLLFDNYDLWPPSLSFTDPFTGDPLPPGVMPVAQAVDFRTDTPTVLIPGMHHETGRAFLCLPGVREYHRHPEHSGDHWLLHRNTGAGTLDAIAATLHRTVASTVLGLSVQTTMVLAGDGVQLQAVVGIAQGRRPGPAASGIAPDEARADVAGPPGPVSPGRVIDLDALPAEPRPAAAGRQA